MAQRLEEALQVLGIPANSDPEQVAEAYRRLARTTHPDVSTDPDAAARFATLTSAYRLASASARSEHSAQHADEPDQPRTDLPTATSAAGTAAGPVGPLGEVSASAWTGPRRPPIIAGPVVVRRFGDETGTA